MGVRPLDIGYQEAGDNGLLRRCLLRLLAWNNERRSLHALIAFSPGFMAPATRRGKPQVFVSHGTRDGVLPIERCSRRIVPQLDHAGYRVRYREFEGGHVVPPEIGHRAVRWFVA